MLSSYEVISISHITIRIYIAQVDQVADPKFHQANILIHVNDCAIPPENDSLAY